MTDIKFPDDHWSQDWSLLRGIAAEWTTVRAMFQWKRMVQNRTVEKRLDQFLGTAAYPNMNRLNDSLRGDEHFCNLLSQLIQGMTELRAPHSELLVQVLLRCNMIVWRNADSWLQRYEGKLKHWGVLCSRENLATELKRADAVLCPLRKGEVRRPTVHLAFDPSEQHEEFDWVDAVEEMVSSGHATPSEGDLFLQWYRQPDADSEQTALESNVSTMTVPVSEMQRIVKKFSRYFKKL